MTSFDNINQIIIEAKVKMWLFCFQAKLSKALKINAIDLGMVIHLHTKHKINRKTTLVLRGSLLFKASQTE